MVRLAWTEQSIDDLYNIYDYISKDSRNYAKIQIKRIRERAKILVSAPKSGRIVPEIGVNYIRELILGNYRIIYKIVSEEQITILTIHHSAKILKM